MPDTIAACSSGSMPCGIAVLRLSGDRAAEILDKVFIPRAKTPVSQAQPRKLYYGRLLARDGRTLDLCMAAFFPGPNSYTGEDLAEFYTHGSQPVAAGLLEHCYALGAVPAPPGEYTRRAFLAGRMDLTEAEAVADLIHAQSELAAKAAAAQLEGSVGSRVQAVRQQLLALLAHFYAVCDYTDEDLEEFDYAHAEEVLERARAELSQLLAGFRRGQLVREGVPVAIIGRPNGGKSTLFNALAGEQKAIVTDEAGTTRDVLEQVISCSGAPIRILDTAGLRGSDSKAERMGVQRARDAALRARAVLCVLDSSSPLSPEDEDALALSQEAPCRALVLNKTDLAPEDPTWLPALLEKYTFDARFHLSAIHGQVESLADWLSQLAPQPGEVLITSARQARLMEQALEDLRAALDSARAGLTADAFLSDAERAINTLGQITGETVSADLAQEIFSRFCVGK